MVRFLYNESVFFFGLAVILLNFFSAKYAENDEMLTISINKSNLDEYKYWKNLLDHYVNNTPTIVKNCGTNIYSILE